MIKKVIALVLVCSILTHAADNREIVVTIEPEGMLCKQVDPDETSFFGLLQLDTSQMGWLEAARAQASHTARMAHLCTYKSIFRSEYERLEKETHGSIGNALCALAPSIADKVDIKPLLPQLLELSVNPQIVEDAIEFIRSLKEDHGVKIIAATHQDFAHNRILRQKLAKKYQTEWSGLFDATVVTEWTGFEVGERVTACSEGLVEQEDQVFMVHEPMGKDSAEYWGVVAAVAQRQVGSGKVFRGIHVDIDADAVATASSQGNFRGHHFDGNLIDLKKSLEEHGIDASGSSTKSANKS